MTRAFHLQVYAGPPLPAEDGYTRNSEMALIAKARGRERHAGKSVLMKFLPTVVCGVLLALPLTAALGASLVVLATSLGLWLSVRCRATFRASVYLILVLAALAAGPPLVAEFVQAVARISAIPEQADDLGTFAPLSSAVPWL